MRLFSLPRLAAALLLALSAAIAAQPAAAAEPTDGFCTTITAVDRVNSSGKKLTDVAAILQQDRANYHRFGRADAGDDGDVSFASAEARARIPAMLKAGSVEADAAQAMLRASPRICVAVYGTRSLDIFSGDNIPPAAPAPVSSNNDAGDLPFLGTWDCEVAYFRFTPKVYNNGSEDLPILEIQEGTDNSYTLFFADDYMITLGDFTADSMTWLSAASGDSFSCTRV